MYDYAYNCSHIQISIKNYIFDDVEVIDDPLDAEILYREKTLDLFRILLKRVGELYAKDRDIAIQRNIDTLKLQTELLRQGKDNPKK